MREACYLQDALKTFDTHFCLLGVCRTKKISVPTNVAEVVESVQELLQSANAPVNTVLWSGVPAAIEGDTTAIAAELNIAKIRISEREFIDTLTVRRHMALLE